MTEVDVQQCDREAASRFMPCDTVADGSKIIDVLSGRCDADHRVQAFARRRLAALASAPAGDGVEALAQAAERAGCKEMPAAIRAGEPVLINSTIALDALARPRAAVGEQSRDAIAACLYGNLYLLTAYNHGAGRVLNWSQLPEADFYRLKCLSLADAILALQSPPAKE